MRNYQLKLKKRDREKVKELLKRGECKARVQTRCRVLLLTEQGRTVLDIAEILEIGPETAQRIRMCYKREGLEAALFDKPRPGKPRRITDKHKQQIVALTCSPPPKGYARWDLGLLAEEAIRRKIIGSISLSSIRRILQEHRLKPWRKKNVVRAKA